MPLPTPRKGEKQDDFMARCMHEAYGSGAPEDRTQEQAVAMCFSQWREAHGGSAPKELDELIAKSPDWQAPDVKTDEQKADAERSEKELLDALAKMPKGLESARERKRLAKEFRVNRSDIDAEIEARRAEAESAAPMHGHWYVEPWPEPADGDALIRDIIKKLRKHVVMPHDHALAIAL